MRPFALILAAAFLVSCSDTPKAAEPKAVKKAARPTDETRRFPMDGRENVEIIEDHILGMDFLPGGNLATYKIGGKTWREFVIKAESPDQTALLVGACKDHMKDPKFLAHMGGYAGSDGQQILYVFPKGRWVAGVVGLPVAEADPYARMLAQRLD